MYFTLKYDGLAIGQISLTWVRILYLTRAVNANVKIHCRSSRDVRAGSTKVHTFQVQFPFARLIHFVKINFSIFIFDVNISVQH